MEIKENILKLLKKHSLSEKLLFEFFSDSNEVKNAIEELKEEGLIVQVRKEYHTAESLNLKKGRIVAIKNDYSFASIEGSDKDAFIYNENLNGAFLGDEVYIRGGLTKYYDYEEVVFSIIKRARTKVVGQIKQYHNEWILDVKDIAPKEMTFVINPTSIKISKNRLTVDLIEQIYIDVKEKDKIVSWIKEFFEINGKGCNAIIGISGGKDSSVVAALCKEALCKERVIGVLLPNGIQEDIDMANLLIKHLDIRSINVNIKDTYLTLLNSIENATSKTDFELSQQTIINLSPRLRMTILYALSQSLNGRVANTCNLSEDWVGYATRYGDSAGDFAPISSYTVQEVKEIGRVLGLPDILVDKVPSDGLCGKTDEDNLGFSYEILDKYLREGTIEDLKIKKIIDHKHLINKFKLEAMPCCDNGLEVLADE